MAEIGTATVKITPVIDEDALAQVDTAVREAVADALRKVADSLVATPNEAETKPRYQAVVIQGVAGIIDNEVPYEWAAYDDEDDFDLAEKGAADLNQGGLRWVWEWTDRPAQ